MSDHPSRLTLERFSVSDLAAPIAQETKGHVDGCASCARYLEELEAESAARLDAFPPSDFVRRVTARPTPVVRLADRRRARVVGAIAALVAAAVLLLVVRSADDDVAQSTVALKGAGISIHRSRDEAVRVMADADALRAGDALRVVVTQPRAAPVAAWFVDARGHVDSFTPGGALALPAGESPLPHSARVEAPCVDLALVVLANPTSVDAIEQGMKTALDAGAPFTGDAWIPRGAIVRRLRCE